MYGIFTYIWVVFRVNAGKYAIHGVSGHDMVVSDFLAAMMTLVIIGPGPGPGPPEPDTLDSLDDTEWGVNAVNLHG